MVWDSQFRGTNKMDELDEALLDILDPSKKGEISNFKMVRSVN